MSDKANSQIADSAEHTGEHIDHLKGLLKEAADALEALTGPITEDSPHFDLYSRLIAALF